MSAARKRRCWRAWRASAASRASARPIPRSRASAVMPTVVNNVETLANVPPIILNGADWYPRHRHEAQPRHQSLHDAGRRQRHRPHRDADGHDAARDHRYLRWRHEERQSLQVRADRWFIGHHHPCRLAGCADGLRLDARRKARGWAVARCLSATRTPTSSIWPMCWFASSRPSPAASARRAASATPRCWKHWIASEGRVRQDSADLDRLEEIANYVQHRFVLWPGTGCTSADPHRIAVLP